MDDLAIGRKRRGPYGKRKCSDDDFEITFATNVVCKHLESELHAHASDQNIKDDAVICDMIQPSTSHESDYSDTSHVSSGNEVSIPVATSGSGYDDLELTNPLADSNHCQIQGVFDVDQMNAILNKVERSDPDLDEIFSQMFEGSFQDGLHEGDIFDDSDVEFESPTEDDTCTRNKTDCLDPDEKPLYPVATITIGAFMLLIALFCTKHNLIGDAVLQLLNIISVALPNEHNLCTSLHAFKKFFRNLQNPLVYHHYCCYCLGYIKDHTLSRCPYAFCNKPLSRSDKPYFLEMPVDVQVKNLFSQTGFFNKLKERFKCKSKNGFFQDIYDGTLYRSYSDNGGPLGFPENISFTFNTDGAPVFKSSKVSIWPLFLVINELPYQIHMKKENMILAGLWFGSQKPLMGTFLCPFLDKFRKMDQGIECISPERGTFVCRAFFLCGTADLPARCLLCNCIQFNGAYSCWKCKQRGETANVGKGHAHVFPFKLDDPKGPERTRSSIIEDARKALDYQDSGLKTHCVDGIKGPSWLTFFPKFHIVHGIAIDYMHGVLLGIQKLLLRLWFAPEFKGKSFNYHNKVCEVDKRLQGIHPTLDITRLPRSIEIDLKHWKASEFRSFLLYFGPVVLHGILDNNRFFHFLLLVNGMHILLKCGSHESDISRAEKMLFEFCQKFAQLYDKCYMTLNIHQLIHLADSVRCLGPLYTHSCFSFEDKNGFILKMIRGTQNIDNQIITGISFIQKLPELKKKFIAKGSDLEKLYNSIESPNVLKRGVMIDNDIYVLGAIKMRTLSDAEYEEMCKYLGHAPISDTFKRFNRLELNGNLIYGHEYGRMTKRDNSSILYQNKDLVCFGHVRFFVILDTNDENYDTVAIVEVLKCPNYDHNCNILGVEKTDKLQIIPVKSIKEGCMYVSFDGALRSYICRFPNRLESD